MTAAKVAQWAAKARESTVRRNEEIRKMRAEGKSLRLIADAAGLSYAGVAKILARTP